MNENRFGTVAFILGGLLLLGVFGAVILKPFFHCCPARKNGCQSNMVQIGKAFKMYSAEWNDMAPTNRTNNRDQFLSNTCRLAGADENRLAHSVNFVEALAPYLEKLEDTRSTQTVWQCPLISRKTYPEHWGDAAISTYCMNWYMAEMPMSTVSLSGNTLLLREMDRRAHALLRPHPSMPPNAENPRGSGAPIHAFPSRNEFGTGDVDPNRHGEGSNILCVDGHVQFYLSTQLNEAPVLDDDLEDETPAAENASRWRVGQIWISL